MIRIVSNVHVDRGGDGDECSSVRVRRLRSSTFFDGGRKNSESRGTGEFPRVDQTAIGEGRKEQTETLRVDVRKKRLQATGTRNVYANRARKRYSIVDSVPELVHAFSAVSLHRAGSDGDIFRRHICTAVTCNLLFSLRPRVVAEIACRIYTLANRVRVNVERGSSLNLTSAPGKTVNVAVYHQDERVSLCTWELSTNCTPLCACIHTVTLTGKGGGAIWPLIETVIVLGNFKYLW